MRIDIITLFPEMFQSLNYGMPRIAQSQDAAAIHTHQLRDFSDDPSRTVDDRPFGGGPGMVLKAEPIRRAIEHVKSENKGRVIYLSPQGKPINDALLRDTIQHTQELILLCGRYEGIDERVINNDVDEEWSLGDFVLSGGEIAALAVCDGLLRLLPGVLGHKESTMNDSFANGLLDHPHYTRPEHLQDEAVPSILLGGNHAEIEKWRKMQSLGVTWLKKPGLFNKISLSCEEKALLDQFKKSLTGV
jgi:tRNA (guanine37-N1)-methyltransferase